jgi:hypothetical protein
MRKSRIWVALTATAVGTVSIAALVSACSTYDQPKAVAEASKAVPETVDWNWHVRPILSQNCFGCHGSGTQKAGLRLDDEKIAKGDLPEDKGKRAIVPGNPGKSEMLRRILSTDVDVRMPPKDTHKTLTPLEIATLQKWVKQGAKYKQHWAYITPKEIKPARTEWDKQAVNPIDRYIYAGLKKAGLSPSAEADRETLINRVTLDLTGLPPTLAEVDAFVADKSPDAYEHLVDRLLNTRAYAERQTNVWLDVARYADTNGGLNDNESPMQFPYRDWVITAFQRNIPYDKFVTWQIAGDKLPGATREQLLATGFLRAGKKDSEGGSIDEEYRTNYVNERAELMGKAFLGLTVGCAKCHNHKYDVISQADYYSMGGFFNSFAERGASFGPQPGATLPWPTPMQEKTQAAAVKVSNDKWAAYQATLTAAKARAARTIDAVPAAQRAAFLQKAIDADTQAYYPLDSGYKADFSLLIEGTPKQPIGALDFTKPLPANLDAREFQSRLQQQILFEAKDRKAHPDKYVAIDKARDEYFASMPKGLAGSTPGPAKAKYLAAKAAAEKSAAQKVSLKKETIASRGKDGNIALGANGMPTRKAGKGEVSPVSVVAPRVDPDKPRRATVDIDNAFKQLTTLGFRDARISDPNVALKPQLRPGLKAEELLWTASGIPGGKPGYLNNVKFVPGAKGQGVQIHNSVGAVDEDVGNFERTDPRTLDFYVKLRAKDYVQDTRPDGPEAEILGNNGSIDGRGYELSLNKGRVEFKIVSNAPVNMIRIRGMKELPRQKWVHITATYDGNSKAAGTRLYQDGKPMPTEVINDALTGGARGGGASTNFGGYHGLSFGTSFNRPELVDGAMDELRVITRALTPAEVAYLHDQRSLAGLNPQEVRASMIDIAASKDPAVIAAWKELTVARLAQQRVEAGISHVLIAGDIAKPRKTYILDRGIYNTYLGETPVQAVPRVYKWDSKLPRNRLGLAQWLFDPKHPLTSRVYVNRMWQNHFGVGIVQTAEDFGTQGSNPTNPELLDYLAIEFIRSGWDIKHMHKLMVMSATYRQSSTITPDRLEKDPRNFLLARGPRYRLSAEQLRDSALFASGLLIDKPGGDAVFPVQPDLIWDGVAQGFVVYPVDTPDDYNHRKSMYSFAKRSQPMANLAVFDLPDRTVSIVTRTMANTPLQALVLLNDPQFLEAYRKLAERSMKASANEDQQLVTLFRLGARRHPSARELQTMRAFRAQETERAAKAPDEVSKMLTIGNAPVDASLDRVKLTAMTVVAAGVMNSPAAYTLR